MAILVTGGAGYIGSHTCVELLNAGYDVVVVDNLCNSSRVSLDRVEKITGKKLKFYEADIRNYNALEEIFGSEKIDWVIHFAGLKAVGESVYKPLEYYHNNVTGTLVLCDVMKKHDVKNIVFSSSANVYGVPDSVPIREDFTLAAFNPYGRIKRVLEEMLRDLYVGDREWNVVILRYFNPIGAHESGLIGENPKGIPNNLLPYINQVAMGKLVCLGVFGNDYDTPDGTCVRDYIHVVDLALGHVKAIEKLEGRCGVWTYNLGTGVGYSVLDVINAFEEANRVEINYVFKERRPGDVSEYYADPTKAREELGWTAERDLKEMCRDSWNWQRLNPYGYDGSDSEEEDE